MIYDGTNWVSYNPSTITGVVSVVSGTDITVDNTDPANPIINYTGTPGGVTSFNTRTGAVTAQTGDYSYSQITGTPTLATVATTGAYSDLTGKPTLGTAAATNSTDYATAAQGTKADNALPASRVTISTSSPSGGSDGDLWFKVS